MNKNLWLLATMLLLGVFMTPVEAATPWSTQDYDLYSGDFDGDGRADILYVAKDKSKASGIARSDGAGPNLPFQSWPANYLGITWSDNVYTVIVADFNADGRSDLFLQRATPGDHYLLLANDEGKFTGIAQVIANNAVGVSDWSAAAHKVIAGNFNAANGADLFLQSTRQSGTNYVVLSDSSGKFTLAPSQSWGNDYLGFKWSTQNANIYAGNFDGAGGADLLIQARPVIVMIDYEITIPIPTYPPNMNGLIRSQGGSTPFQLAGVQQWSRFSNGVDWAPNTSTVVVGDFDGNGRTDVVLQARYSGKTSYLLSGNASGAAFATGSAMASNVAWSSDGYRLVAGNFDGTGGTGIYLQATTSGGTNYYANTVTGSSVSTTTHNPSGATGVLPTTAVGHTVGSFTVSNTGAATYSIPIVVPPGVAGVRPALSINYQSGTGNGLLGMGWNLGGFSEIQRCSKTIAQDASSDAFSLSVSDRFCLDGNKLRLTGGAYGAAGSTYQTELETFAKVTAVGTAGNGPASFTVESKDGLVYEYGNSADSRIEAINAPVNYSTPHTWALNEVSDRHGNTMTISYTKDGAPNGSFRPAEILYTANAGASLAAAYKVTFVWGARSTEDVLTAYVGGGLVKEVNRLNRIETYYNNGGSWSLVRKYLLSYNTNGSTPRTRLGSVQECEGGGACLAPTMIRWQDGSSGWVGSDTTSASNSAAMMEYSYPIDINGDGRDDLVYPETVSGTTRWHFMTANGTGGFNAPVNTGIAAGDSTNFQYARAQPIDYFSEGRMGLLVDAPSYSTRQILRWNGSTLALTNTNLTIALDGNKWVGDFDGDGRADVLYTTYNSSNGTGYFYIQKNSGATSGTATFAAAVQFYSSSASADMAFFKNDFGGWSSRLLDFNGDGRSDLIYSVTTVSSGCGPATPLLCFYNTTWTALTATGTGFAAALTWTCSSIASPCGIPPVVGDFNGDGLTDVISLAGALAGPSTPGTSTWRVSYGSGTGLTAPANISLPTDFSTLTAAASHFPADYDSDGRVDLVYAPSATSGSWYALRSTGTGFEAPVAISLTSSSANNTIRVLDLDGDGLRDIGFKSSQYRVRKHRGVVPDLVQGITDGYGNDVAIEYRPLTDATFYTKGTGASFPKVDIQGAIYAVKSYSASDGIGGVYTTSLKYEHMRFDVQGRGMLGFEFRESIDGRSGIKSRLKFSQDFPFTGLVLDAATYQSASGPLMAQVTNSLDQLPVQGGTNQQRRLPYVKTSVQKSFEVGGPNNGAAISEISTSTTLDSYGNKTNVTSTTTDKTGSALTYTSATVTAYATTDADCGWRGLATQQQVTNTVPGYAAQTRTVQFTKDTAVPKACRIKEEIVEPADSTLKVTTTYAYDAFGHPSSQAVSATGIETRTASTSYGAQGVFPMSVTESVTSSFSQTASKTYDYALGVPKSATDPNGLQVAWAYDGFGRMTQETRPDGTKTTWIYSACGVGNGYCGDSRLRYQVEKRELDSAGNVIRASQQLFDAYGRSLYDQSQTLSGAYSTVATNYDVQGRIRQRSQPYFTGLSRYFTTISYDLMDRPTLEERPVNDYGTGTQTVEYGYNRLIHTHQDANGKVTTKQFNAIGQVTKVTDALSGITQYEYDPFGNLKKTTDPAGNQIVNTFNIRGFKTATSDPDMGTWGYTYYPTGELKTQTDAKSQTVTFTYDRLSRPKTRVEVEGTTTYVYGESSANKNIGKLQSVSSPGSYSQSYLYDALGRVQSVTTNADATSFVVSSSYNSTTGFLETVTYPTSTSAVTGSRFKVQYDYEKGLLKRVKDFNTPATVYWEQIATNAAGQTIDELYGNGLHTYSSYDNVTGLLGARTAGATSEVQDLAYQWDKLGNLLQRKDQSLSLTEDFTYDDLYRLKTSKLNGVANLGLTYFANGNIQTKSDVGTYSYPTQGTGSVRPHAVTAAGSRSYAYDSNGNMTSRGTDALTWYSYNKPNRLNEGSNYSQFYYDANRDRYKQVAYTAAGGTLPSGTETTIYVGGLYERVTKPSGVIEHKHYIMAGGEAIAIRTLRSNSADDTRYLHKDHLGSVDTITNESGAVVQRLSYDAFGKRRNATTWSGALGTGDWTSIAAITHRAFTFHEQLDNVDLINMNGRVYDPDIGRFISADPFIQAPLMSQSLNRYSYVMNNPLSMIDPSGYSWLGDLFKSIGKFFSKYWREIVAVVVTVVSMGTLGPIVGAAGGFWGAVAVGAVAGAIYGGTVTALYGGSLGDVLQGALTGAIAGGVAAGIGYGMGQVFGPSGAEKPIDFGWKSLGSEAGDVVLPSTSSGINDAMVRGINAARDFVKMTTDAGENAAQYWADKAAQTGNPFYNVPGAFAALWTRDTALTTASVLTAGPGIASAFRAYQAASAAKTLIVDHAATGATIVYRSVNAAGEVQYVGITNNLARRAAEHLRGSGIQIEKVMGGLSRSDARAVEQVLIETHGLGKNGGTLLNRINSISSSNPTYVDQVKRGHELLQAIGY